ncbi:1-phosphatidylinositol 4,5-bisphosphate phosphodiesterase epsilon-1-like, partial [Sitodiplosis mosellana]|uniref:1-phosphatidylinositol 4,5-bisphosphate phosphodiesterase epsilon-1-like n=1 Tax=Sitodiplosis mosellana TaxID=263140 RepID=UPI002443812A
KTFHTIFGSVDERASRHSLSSYSTPTRRVEIDDKLKKRSSQISRELSDIVNYVQAIKFRGLNPITPQNSIRIQQPMPTKLDSSGSLVTVGSILRTSSVSPCAPQTGSNPLDESVQSVSIESTPVQLSLIQSETDSQSVGTSAITTITTTTTTTTTTTATTTTITTSTATSTAACCTTSTHRKLHHVNVNYPCYQCSSVNEPSAKKLCRKHPLALIAHTETQLMRTYPAGLRIDSSNFNPVFFWAFGIQLVALNYQTDDLPLAINTGMFEENGSCGYVLKPDVLWDHTHLMYRRFNPLEREFDGLHSSQIVMNIVSGQFVQQSNLQASTFVEVEMIGIPVDCSKKKTRVIRRNALNPIWNDTFFFKVMFHDLAFLKFSVFDNDTNQMVSQRVIPLKCLRPGYRHVRLRSPNNQPLSMAALFVYSRVEEESFERTSDETDEYCGISGYNKIDNTHTSTDFMKSCDSRETSGTPIKDAQKSVTATMVSANIPLKRRMFFVMVYGVITGEPFTILRATQESTTRELIAQALQKSNRIGQNVNDYILVAEVGRGWKKKDRDLPATQRVLDMHEKVLHTQAMWQGEGRFIFKKIGNDPSSRAWLTSIRSVSERRAMFTNGEENTSNSASNETPTSWDDDDTFLVCVYNVSPDIPYAILKAPINATAQDVLAQSLLKARRMEDPNSFILIEELEYGSTGTVIST